MGFCFCHEIPEKPGIVMGFFDLLDKDDAFCLQNWKFCYFSVGLFVSVISFLYFPQMIKQYIFYEHITVILLTKHLKTFV